MRTSWRRCVPSGSPSPSSISGRFRPGRASGSPPSSTIRRRPSECRLRATIRSSSRSTGPPGRRFRGTSYPFPMSAPWSSRQPMPASRSSSPPPCRRSSFASPSTGSTAASAISRCMPSRAVPLLVLAGFSLLTLIVLRPTLSEVAHTAPAFHGFVADALLLMWATSHVSRAFFADPLHLFEAGIYHPARHTLAFGDHMIGQALVGLPVWLATKNPVLEYNVLALASYALGAPA